VVIAVVVVVVVPPPRGYSFIGVLVGVSEFVSRITQKLLGRFSQNSTGQEGGAWAAKETYMVVIRMTLRTLDLGLGGVGLPPYSAWEDVLPPVCTSRQMSPTEIFVCDLPIKIRRYCLSSAC